MQEGFGFTAIEGMACAKPVVWSEQPAIREATGGIGLPFQAGQVEQMRDQMQRLIEEPELVKKLGAEGRDYVASHYAWPAVWKRYEDLLSQVASQAKR